MPVIMNKSGEMYELLQKTRSRLRYMAHRYVGSKRKDKFHSDQAAAEMETAALTFALAAAQWGATSDCARPAGKDGEEWKASLDPEELLKSEELRYTAEVVTTDPSFKKLLGKKKRRAR